jgi:hypothetical protein
MAASISYGCRTPAAGVIAGCSIGVAETMREPAGAAQRLEPVCGAPAATSVRDNQQPSF